MAYPRFRTEFGGVGVETFIRMPELDTYPRTYITADVAAGATSVTVADTASFSSNDYIVIGKIGEQQAELRQMTGKTATTMTGLTALTFDHSQNTHVFFIPFNQVQLEKDTGSGYASLAQVTLRVDQPEFFYLDTAGLAADNYRFRLGNTTTLGVTAYSDVWLATGPGDNTVFAVKKRAVETSGMLLGDIYKGESLITDKFLNEALFEGRRFVHHRLKRWSFRQQFDYNNGNVTAGMISAALPTDMQDTNSTKNLLSARIGSSRVDMTPISKREWNVLQQGRTHTTLGAAITAVGNTTVTLTDSSDFDESGAISIVDAGTEDTIDYTANNETTNVLSGVTNITATHVISLDVWQDPSYALPTQYTVFEGRIYFNCPIHPDFHAENLYLDYYKTVVTVNSDADTFDEPDYDMYVYYLKWRIKQARNQGLIADQDPDYKEFSFRTERMAQNELSDQPISIIPDISGYSDEIT